VTDLEFLLDDSDYPAFLVNLAGFLTQAASKVQESDIQTALVQAERRLRVQANQIRQTQRVLNPGR
jgi:hypothetical protein